MASVRGIILLAAIIGGAVSQDTFQFSMEVLSNQFKNCYVQLFEQSVNNLSIHNKTTTFLIEFSTTSSKLAISQCSSTSIVISVSTANLDFSSSLVFGGDADQSNSCINSIATNAIALSTSPHTDSDCYCQSAYDGYLTSYFTGSNSACNITMQTTWTGPVSNTFMVTFYSLDDPVDYPASIVFSTSSSSLPASTPAAAPVAVAIERPADIKKYAVDSTIATTSSSYSVGLYVLIDQFANCVPSLFSQSVNDLQATNQSDIVYITFQTNLGSIDVSQCNFVEIVIQGSDMPTSFSSGLVFSDQSQCQTSVASNVVSVSAPPGGCNTNSCPYGCSGCQTAFFSGLSTSSASTCEIELVTQWSGSLASTFSDTHTYFMLDAPSAYPSSFTVSF